MNNDNPFDSTRDVHGNPIAYIASSWPVIMFLNQVAEGSKFECRDIVRQYGGSEDFADQLWEASRKIVVNKRSTRNAQCELYTPELSYQQTENRS